MKMFLDILAMFIIAVVILLIAGVIIAAVIHSIEVRIAFGFIGSLFALAWAVDHLKKF